MRSKFAEHRGTKFSPSLHLLEERRTEHLTDFFAGHAPVQNLPCRPSQFITTCEVVRGVELREGPLHKRNATGS